MKLPRGRLVRQRVVSDPGTALESAFERELTGYGRFESQDALLLDAEGVGVITFEAGVPAVAYHTGTDRGGPPALADLAVEGPIRLELYELDSADVTRLNEAPDLRVPPGMPAERLAGDPELAGRTRDRAPDYREVGPAAVDTGNQPTAVEAFLEDESKISAIREAARAEAERRAAEWDL